MRTHLELFCRLADVHDDDADEDVAEDEVSHEYKDHGVDPAVRQIPVIQSVLYIRPSVRLPT